MLFHAIFYWLLDKLNGWLIKPKKMSPEEVEQSIQKARENGYSEAEIEKTLETMRENGLI